MWIIQPEISHSNEKNKKATIFSIHVDPSGCRLATGSQDCTIRLWDVKALLTTSKERENNTPVTLLSTLTIHTGAVLCVRWSNRHGNLLASGSDDKSIIIWIKQEKTFVSNPNNIESWKSLKTLYGHKSDVSDLAWSSDNTILASASFDGTIMLWNCENFERMHCITGHTGFVKGVCWVIISIDYLTYIQDPVGKYLASQSDDKTLKIWRTSDWGLEVSINAPYEAAPSSTYFRRLSWSPDGSCIVSANGENGTMPTAPIINRDGWAYDVAIFGHQNPVECAAFNPRLFKIDGKDSAICAIGSQDCGVSVWWTSKPRSILATTRLYSHSVLDMCWTADGYNLISCSFDGSVSIFQFDQEDLGVPSDTQILNSLLSKFGYNKSSKFIPEDPIAIQPDLNNSTPMELGIEISLADPTDKLMALRESLRSAETIVPKTSTEITSLQKVSQTKDGKKRITPVFLGSNSTLSNTVQEANAISFVSDEPQKSDQPPIHYTLPVVSVSDEKSPSLALPDLRKRIVVSKKDSDVSIECKNEAGKCNITCTESGEMLWRSLVNSSVLLATITLSFYAFSTVSGEVLVYSKMGRRLFPPFSLDSPSAFFDSCGRFLIYVSMLGKCFVWDIESKSVCISGISVLPVLKPKSKSQQLLSITQVRLSDSGAPKLYLSDGTVKLYDIEMGVWLVLEDVLSKNSTALSMLKDVVIQRFSSSQLENHLLTASLEHNFKEYRRYWVMYIKRLCEEESRGKLLEICDDLSLGKKSEFELLMEQRMGITRKQMLDETVQLIGSYSQLQRIASIYRS